MKRIILMCMVLSALFLSCKNEFEEDFIVSLSSKKSSANFTSKISHLKEIGLFDSILQEKSDRAIENSGDKTEVNLFIENPDKYIEENSNDDSEESLNLFTLIYDGGTIEDVYNSMLVVSPEMAEEYLDTVTKSINSSETSAGRTAMAVDSIKSINLSFFENSYDNMSRGIYASNLNRDTVNWYYGMCATTIAGLTAYKFFSWWQPWVRVAGLATAIAGGASMAFQLGVWYVCTDFKAWVTSFVNRDSEEATKILNSEIGLKVLGISTATAGVVAYCYFVTPELSRPVIKFVKEKWNSILIFIRTAINTNIKLSFFHIPLDLL